MDWIGRRRGRLIKGDLRASVRRFVFYALDEREEWRWRCGRAELQRADKTLHTFPGVAPHDGLIPNYKHKDLSPPVGVALFSLFWQHEVHLDLSYFEVLFGQKTYVKSR